MNIFKKIHRFFFPLPAKTNVCTPWMVAYNLHNLIDLSKCDNTTSPIFHTEHLKNKGYNHWNGTMTCDGTGYPCQTTMKSGDGYGHWREIEECNHTEKLKILLNTKKDGSLRNSMENDGIGFDPHIIRSPLTVFFWGKMNYITLAGDGEEPNRFSEDCNFTFPG